MGLKKGDLVMVVGNTEPKHYIAIGTTCTVRYVSSYTIDIMGADFKTGITISQTVNPEDIEPLEPVDDAGGSSGD